MLFSSDCPNITISVYTGYLQVKIFIKRIKTFCETDPLERIYEMQPPSHLKTSKFLNLLNSAAAGAENALAPGLLEASGVRQKDRE